MSDLNELVGKVLGEIRRAKRETPMLRYGQVAFNVAYASWPEAANRLRGTSYDPFHDSSRVDAFLTELLTDVLTEPEDPR